MPIGFRFPFKNSSEGGVLASTKTSQDAVRSNLISLLTTKRGHRPMRAGLFSPLYDYINEPIDEITISRMKDDVEDKIVEYIPEIQVREISITPYEDENRLSVQIVYSLNFLANALDSVNITILTEQNT